MPPIGHRPQRAEHHLAGVGDSQCARARAAGTAVRSDAETSARRRSRRCARSNAPRNWRRDRLRARRRRHRSAAGAGLRDALPTARRSSAPTLDAVSRFLTPGRAISLKDVDEPGPAPLRCRREIRAAVERLQVGRQPDAHRPPARPGGGLHERHVDAVDVRAFLAVHLDRNEVAVQDAAIAASSNDSCAMTWHQWHVE